MKAYGLHAALWQTGARHKIKQEKTGLPRDSQVLSGDKASTSASSAWRTVTPLQMLLPLCLRFAQPARVAPASIKDLLRLTGGSGREAARWMALALESLEEARLTSRLTLVDAAVDALPALMLLDMRR